MGNTIPTEKLDRNNFASLELRRSSTQKSTQPNTCWPSNLVVSRELCVVLPCIMRSWSHARLHPSGQHAKRGMGNLKKIFVTNTITRKLQLRQELNNIQQRDMSIGSYNLNHSSTPYGRLSSRGRILPPSLISNWCNWWKKTTSEQEGTHMTDRCSTRTRMKEQDKAMEEGANQAKAGTTKRHPKNTTSTTDKMLRTREAKR